MLLINNHYLPSNFIQFPLSLTSTKPTTFGHFQEVEVITCNAKGRIPLRCDLKEVVFIVVPPAKA